MTAFWVSIPIGILIVLLAVGWPFWLTHRRMRPHYDSTQAQAYLDATGKTPQDAVEGQPGSKDWQNADGSQSWGDTAGYEPHQAERH
jgi:hypothetical protein